jgi:hypothetical protein
MDRLGLLLALELVHRADACLGCRAYRDKCKSRDLCLDDDLRQGCALLGKANNYILWRFRLVCISRLALALLLWPLESHPL